MTHVIVSAPAVTVWSLPLQKPQHQCQNQCFVLKNNSHNHNYNKSNVFRLVYPPPSRYGQKVTKDFETLRLWMLHWNSVCCSICLFSCKFYIDKNNASVTVKVNWLWDHGTAALSTHLLNYAIVIITLKITPSNIQFNGWVNTLMQ